MKKLDISSIIFSKNTFVIFLLISIFLRYASDIIDFVIFPYIIIPWAAMLLYKNYQKKINIEQYHSNMLLWVLVYFIIISIYHFIVRKPAIDYIVEDIYFMAILFFVVYPNYNLNNSVQKSVLVFSKIYVAFVSALSSIGLYAVLSKQLIYINSTCFAGMQNSFNRLYVFAYPNTSAILCTFAIFFTLYLYFNTNSLTYKCIYIFSILINFVAMALTQTRTATVIFSVAMALFIFMLILKADTIKRLWLKLIVAMLVATFCVGTFYAGYKAVIKVYTHFTALSMAEIKMQEQEKQAEAKVIISVEKSIDKEQMATVANEEEKTKEDSQEELYSKSKNSIRIRKLNDGLNTFSNRTTIWKAAVKSIIHEPLMMLHGTLNDSVMTHVNEFMDDTNNKSVHNSYLNILMVGGLPSFVLLFVFVLKLLPKQLRLLFKDKNKKASFIFPIMFLSMLAIGLLESSLVYSWSIINILLFVIMGFSVYFANEV